MEVKNYNVIGVMSGTSLDGVDCAFTKISKTETYSATIIVAQTFPYPDEWKEKLTVAHTLTTAERDVLDVEYTRYLAQVINTFINKNDLNNIDAVCSHGHTVLHQPEDGITVQIGNKQALAQLTNQKVVCDFRVQDVALGGQGAPLVPIGDQLLFNAYDYCLNLGGFANVSMQRNGIRVAYDICPVNVVLNKYAQELREPYDDEGAFAKAGTPHKPLLEALNSLSFYALPAPKSLGIEWVHDHIFPLIEVFDVSPMDVLATFTEHVAYQLAQSFKKGGSVLATGGGAYNTYLLSRVEAHFSAEKAFRGGGLIKIIVPETSLLEFKEALVFALLGVLKLEGENNCLASVTGASRDHCSGKIFIPDDNIK